ncbi:MAG: hypothetical protein HY320_04470 [Armatimonadetes bacterium]|nr:hypothetical protein [Armatimonadota bacterium]
MRAQHTIGRRGSSLVEVLVVLVVFVVGILGIARLFPQGFGSLRYGEHASVAYTLTRALEEYLRGRVQNLPDGVVSVDYATGRMKGDVSPGEFLLSQPYPGLDASDPRYSVLNRARRVVGETFVVPPPVSNSPFVLSGSVSLDTLMFGPVYAVDPIPGQSLGLDVYSGTPLRVQPVGEDFDAQDVASLNLDTVAINYDTATLFFRPVPYARQFKLSYRYDVSAGPGFVRLDTPLDLGFTLAPSEFRYSLSLPLGVTLVRGTEKLYRRFNRLAATDSFTDDPYQYKVLNPVTGLLGFNPLGARIASPASEALGLQVRVDYDVDDWWILREERVVPAESPHVVKLAVPYVKRLGEMEDWVNFDSAGNPTLQYQSLMRTFPGRPSGTPGIDVLVVDMETGLTLDSSTLAPSGQVGLNGEMDYRTGEIRFADQLSWSNPAGGGPIITPATGRNVRVYYRGSFDWGVSLRKPFARYTLQQPSSPLPPLAYREYTQGSFGYLFFPVSDGEESVLVDYEWRQASTGAVRSVTGELHLVRNPDDPGSPKRLYGSSSPYWWVRVGNPDGDPGNGADTDRNPDVVPGSVDILGVRGASLHTHVVWREGSDWRHLQATTVMERSRP